jgi:hypothetical protein
MTQQEDRTKKLLNELLHRLIEELLSTGIYDPYSIISDKQTMNDLIDELSKRYDVYLKHQDNEFRDE